MDINEILEQRKKMKKIEIKSRKLILSNDDVDISTWFEMNFEVWYDKIKNETIKTVFIDLSLNDVAKFIEKDTEFLDHLSKRIDNILMKTFKKSGGFVKLSCRSPKDATVVSEKVDDIVKKTKEKNPQIRDNDLAKVLYDVHINALKVLNGKEAVDLLLKSGRVLTDLKYSKKNGTPVQLLVRKWEEISIHHEFRGFVFNKNLNALSQYFDLLYFEELKDFKPGIIKKFFDEQIKDKIKWGDNFIIDFGITKTGRIVVIELNPWTYTTDSVCFNWVKDLDILEGKRGFTFRKRNFAVKRLKNIVISPWKKYFS